MTCSGVLRVAFAHESIRDVAFAGSERQSIREVVECLRDAFGPFWS